MQWRHFFPPSPESDRQLWTPVSCIMLRPPFEQSLGLDRVCQIAVGIGQAFCLKGGEELFLLEEEGNTFLGHRYGKD